jgi:hypothetical protein
MALGWILGVLWGLRLGGLVCFQKWSQKTCCFLDRLGGPKGSFLEPFWEGKSVQNGDLTKLDVKKVNFQKSAFSFGGSTILKDKHAWKSNENSSKALLRGNFFALNFRSRILIDFGSVLVPFWLPKWSQVGSKKFKKIAKNANKCLINNGDGPRRRSRSSWGGPGAILRGSWGGPGGSGAAPGGISEAFWGAKIGANSESAIRSDNKQRSEARAAERNTESQNKL